MTRFTILPSGYRPPSHPPVDNPVSVRAIDKTEGIPITDARTQIDTVRPVALVRARELEALGILVSDLPEGSLILNGATWIIKSYRQRTSPYGEADGEVMLILTAE